MIPTIATRFRCSSPLTDLKKLTIMFETLELQYLNKLIKCEVRDFASPKPFHTVKVQRLGNDKVEPSAEVDCKFPVPVFALVGDFTVKPCQFSHSTPPIARAFNLTRQAFIEFSELVQDSFKGCGCCIFSPVFSVR